MVAPCDGKVISILKLNEMTTHVAIYLSLLDPHVQWCPVNGTVLSCIHKKGTFNPAYMFHKSRYNERVETIVYVPQIDDEIKIVQIAGQVARRIVNYKDKKYDKFERGELMGLIKFGSRVDLFIPHHKVDLLMNQGDVLFGNKTIIGKMIY
jgi:phosphatidylserine decarboxylase